MAGKREKNTPASSAWTKVKNVLLGIAGVFHGFGSLVYKLRKFVMAVPVLIGLVYLTNLNNENLPDRVGLVLQSSGEFSLTVSKEFALLGPVALTIACLLMMFASKKTLQPWVVSIFTLTLPLLVFALNVFPG